MDDARKKRAERTARYLAAHPGAKVGLLQSEVRLSRMVQQARAAALAAGNVALADKLGRYAEGEGFRELIALLQDPETRESIILELMGRT